MVRPGVPAADRRSLDANHGQRRGEEDPESANLVGRMMLTRRGLLAIGLGAVTAGAGLAQRARGGDSVLRVRPHQPTTSVTPGEHALDLGGDRDGLLIVPQQY